MAGIRGQIGRNDLLQALCKDEPSAKFIAKQLGLSKRVVITPVEPPSFGIEMGSNPAKTELAQPIQFNEPAQPRITSPADRISTEFWYLQSREAVDTALQQTQQVQEVSYTAWHNRPQQIAKPTPLLPAQALLAKLQPLFQQSQQGNKVDLDKVVQTLSRGEYLHKIPRCHSKQQQAPLQLIDDRSRYLSCYWQDHFHACATLLHSKQFPELSVNVWIDGHEQPNRLSQEGLGTWQITPHSTVLVLTDLGVLSHSRQAMQRWLHFGRLLQHKQCQVLALIPCAPALVPSSLRRLYHCVPWEQSIPCSGESVSAQVERLLTVLAPCIRLEPALIRALRLVMAQHGKPWEIPAAVEARLWQHAAIKEPHSVAATWGSSARHTYLEAFKKLDTAEQTTALNTIRQWRAELDECIWYEEILSLSPVTQQLDCIQDDVQQAQQYVENLAQRFTNPAELHHDRDSVAWFKRLEQRLPQEQVVASPSLQRLSDKVHQADPQFDRRWIDPQNLAPSNQPVQQAVLYQRGQCLYLKPYEPFELPRYGYSHLALLKCRHENVQISAAGQALASLRLNDPQGWQLPNSGKLTIKSDQETLLLATQPMIEGLSFGRDVYGLYVDIELFGVLQRFRYIEPSRFMMGSPKTEPGRVGQYESYRHVSLTQGYWLADTACTQALWQAVMGENPASFKDNLQNPVENVSWLEAQQFLSKLNQAIPQLKAHLPTEAQWENACRAGTTTPFSFEGEIDLDKVNYRGTWELEEITSGNYRWGAGVVEQTAPVQHYPANAWGLYEMHGNVLEWCLDEWQDNLGTDSVVDPVNASFKSGVKPDLAGIKPEQSLANTGSVLENTSVYDSTLLANAEDGVLQRVLRGGSWIDSGGNCRSAIRYRLTAVLRYRDGGFRIALGHELQHSAGWRSHQAQSQALRE